MPWSSFFSAFPLILYPFGILTYSYCCIATDETQTCLCLYSSFSWATNPQTTGWHPDLAVPLASQLSTSQVNYISIPPILASSSIFLLMTLPSSTQSPTSTCVHYSFFRCHPYLVISNQPPIPMQSPSWISLYSSFRRPSSSLIWTMAVACSSVSLSSPP